MISPRHPYLASFFILSIVCYLAFFYRLGDPALWDPDEGRSAVIAKEMVTSGNWVTLTHEGKPYYDKPAPYFWLVALGLKTLGLSEFAVRLPSALAAALTVAAVWLWGCIFGGWKRGFWAGLTLATSAEFIALGHFGKMDMLFSLFFSTGLLYFLWWQRRILPPSRPETTRQTGMSRWQPPIWPFYALLALAVLAKGPVGALLPLLIVMIAPALTGKWTVLQKMRPFEGLLVMLLVAGPWYLLALLRDPEYIRTFIWEHNVLRFLTSRREIHHSESVFYFFPLLMGGFLPWSLLLPAVLHHLWEKRGEEGHEERWFLFVWFATVFIFFTLSRNKLGTYILPLFPPLALLTGDCLGQFAEGRVTRGWHRRWILYASFAWLFSLTLLPPVSELLLKHRHSQYLPIDLPLFPFLALTLLAAIAWVRGKERWTPLIVSLSILWMVLWFQGAKASQISELRSTRSLARVLTETDGRDYRVVIIRAESFPFYYPHRAQVVRNLQTIERMLKEPIPTVALIKDKHLREMRTMALPRLFVWKRIPFARVLVANFPPHPAQGSDRGKLNMQPSD